MHRFRLEAQQLCSTGGQPGVAVTGDLPPGCLFASTSHTVQTPGVFGSSGGLTPCRVSTVYYE